MTTQTQESVTDRVARGIELLDERGPADWRYRVDVETLVFSDDRHCILGQIFGSLPFGWSALGLDEMCSFYAEHAPETAYRYGFSASAHTMMPNFNGSGPADHVALIEAWRAALSD